MHIGYFCHAVLLSQWNDRWCMWMKQLYLLRNTLARGYRLYRLRAKSKSHVFYIHNISWMHTCYLWLIMLFIGPIYLEIEVEPDHRQSRNVESSPTKVLQIAFCTLYHYTNWHIYLFLIFSKGQWNPIFKMCVIYT